MDSNHDEVYTAPDEDDTVHGHQQVMVRRIALREAVKWTKYPGARPSDVVAVALWFESFLLGNETPPAEEPARGSDEECIP